MKLSQWFNYHSIGWKRKKKYHLITAVIKVYNSTLPPSIYFHQLKQWIKNKNKKEHKINPLFSHLGLIHEELSLPFVCFCRKNEKMEDSSLKVEKLLLQQESKASQLEGYSRIFYWMIWVFSVYKHLLHRLLYQNQKSN